MREQTETNHQMEKSPSDLADLSGRFDDLGEDLMKLSSREHVCTIYRKGEDKIDSIMEFIKTGVVKNERCIVIVDKKTKEDILSKIKSQKEIKNLLNGSAIVLVDAEEVYGKNTDYNFAKTNESIESYLDIPLEDNNKGLRLIIEILPFTHKDTTFNILTDFHSNMDKLISNRDISLFCLYNEYKFESRTLLDIIVTHSKLIFNGYLCNNSLFMDPHKLQLIREDKLDETLYKKVVYEIVQREITEQKREKKNSYI